MKISVQNPTLGEDEMTHITVDYSSGTNIYVRNSEGFTTSWYAVIGEPGQEQTEARAVASISGGNTIAVATAPTYSHPKATPVYLSQWDKVSFEQKASGGSFAEISGSPFSIEWDDENLSTVISFTGASTDTYRWRFYNSTLATYSDYSDELAGTGFTRHTVGYAIQQVKRNSVAKDIDDEILLDYMNDYQMDVVYPEIPKAFWFSKEGSQVATTASAYTFAISTNWSDFLSTNLVLYRYINGTNDIKYPLSFRTPTEFYNLKADTSQATDDYVKYWTMLPPDSTSAKGYFAVHPTPKTDDCYLQPIYYFELTDLDSFGDTLVVPYSKGYIDYCLYRIFDDIKSDTGQAEKYNLRVMRGITYLKRLARRQLGQPEFFRFRGHRGFSRMYGEQGLPSSTEARELYW